MSKTPNKSPDLDAATNAQIQETVEWVNNTVVSASGDVGAGIATQAVSHASIVAVQDAEAYMRGVMTVCTAAYSAAFGEILRNPQHQKEVMAVIAEASSLVSLAITQFRETGQAAADVVEAIKAAEGALSASPVKKGKAG